MNKLTPTSTLMLALVKLSPEPMHLGDLLKTCRCSVNTMRRAISALTREGLIARVDQGDGPRYRAVAQPGDLLPSDKRLLEIWANGGAGVQA